MNQQDTAHLYRTWSPGMAVTLSLFKKLATPSGATSDPFAAAIVLTACRKRGIDDKMALAYADVIELTRARLFEIWPAANAQPTGVVSNGDILQEAGGARWIVKAKPQTIFDNATLALCMPE